MIARFAYQKSAAGPTNLRRCARRKALS